jgi:hypothetical protein
MKYRSSAIIKFDNGENHHILCGNPQCNSADVEEVIPIYYSYIQLLSCGWTKEKDELIFYCPTCGKG